MPFPYSYLQNNITRGLVGWWKLNDGIGSIAKDSSGYGNNATLVNSPIWVNGKIPGKALNFNGTNQYLTIPSINSFGTSSTATFTAWVYSIANQSNYAGIFLTHATFYCGLATGSVADGDTNVISVMWNGTGSEYNFGGPLIIPNGLWTFVAGVVTTTGIRIYMNKQSVFHTETTDSNRTMAGEWAIGRDLSAAGRYWNGYINDVRIYNVNLSPQEILALYEYNGTF